MWTFVFVAVLALASVNGQTDGDVRLVDGTATTNGRLEVFHEGAWGTVCDDGFSHDSAAVVCRQLGFSGLSRSVPGVYPQGDGMNIFLDDVRCAGTEATISECQHAGWGVHNCQHSEDVGVDCDAGAWGDDIRLTGGTTESNGRLEILHAGSWGTVCDDGFGSNEAVVACRMLGHNPAYAFAYSSDFFGEGSGDIWLDQLNCNPNATSFRECDHNAIGDHDCDHSEDIGVDCSVSIDDIRLVDGDTQYKGRVEISHNGQWGTICDDSWSTNEAKVACRMLGFGAVGAMAYGVSRFGAADNTTQIWLDQLSCNGDEVSLALCRPNPWGMHDCTHDEDAGVGCVDQTLELQDIRLVPSNVENQGVVEVQYMDEWGTVCDDSFNIASAQVICRMLGFDPANAHTGFSLQLSDAERIWLDELACTGTEESIMDCQRSPWGEHNCGHHEDIVVGCGPTPESVG